MRFCCLWARAGHAVVWKRHSPPACAYVAGRSSAAGAYLQSDDDAYGTPVIRYGDEIGMGDDLRLPERNCARTPMQWSIEPQAGFTESDHPILPVISDGPY